MQGKKIQRYRRFHGYDYSRGAAVFVTFTLEPRFPAFGRVSGREMLLSPAGECLKETILTEAVRPGPVSLHSWVVMPDHVHLHLYIAPGAANPLSALGGFVNNVKRWSKWKAAQLGTSISWQTNYHDRICVSREIISRVDKYIENNPLKWTLMHGPGSPMKVIEPISSPWFSPEDWWTGVGNTELAGENAKLAAFQLSRRISAQDIPGVVERCLGAVRRGYTPISTFISPAERALAAALDAAGAPIVRVLPDPLEAIYRPKEDEPAAFAAGRLLKLSRIAGAGESRYGAWHSLNDAIAEMALASAGAAVYVVPPGPGAKPQWLFRQQIRQQIRQP